MYYTRKCIVVLFAALCTLQARAQTHTQSIRGSVIDQESQVPLIGANVFVEKTIPLLGVSTDEQGTFIIEDVPVGRQTLVVSYVGYEPITIPDVMVISGKQMVLEIELTEATVDLEEAVIRPDLPPGSVLNEMALISARAFTVEETSRYPASFLDPARMAQNYAGVSFAGGSSDLFNEIIVRGNSPRGVLWRLEGIEIPNPNHFGALGNTGGGISMLSSSTLANSDFYTAAFPAEFGNASSGVFDLNLRKGNSEEREYAVMVGLLGVEGALEGPFSSGGKASYLLNVRYSTLGMLEALGLSPVADVLPTYGDVSFNISMPTQQFGQFNLFGLGGYNKAYFEPDSDSSLWESSDDSEGFDERQWTGTVGIAHKLLLSGESYLKTVVAVSAERFEGEGYYLDEENQYQRIEDYADVFDDKVIRLSSTYNRKINAQQSFKVGGIISHRKFQFFAQHLDDDLGEQLIYLQNNGDATQYQVFGQYKWRANEHLTLTGGVHFNYFGLNKHASVEPRFGLQWDVNTKNAITVGLGLHSKPEHPAFYYVETTQSGETRDQPNFNLDYTKSLHAVVGYKHHFNKHMRINLEAYYQHLFDVPVELDPATRGSMLNVLDIWDILDSGPAENSGLGRNAGLDVTVERNFNRQYYFMFTGSLFDSRFRAIDDQWYNTRFNTNYQVNFLGGREWKVGKTKDNILGLNAKVLYNGGEKFTPIDLDASRVQGKTVRVNSRYLRESIGRYYRVDLSVSYKVNRPRLTHTFQLEIQNITNRQNPFDVYYDVDLVNLDYEYHTGLFPVLNYRVEF